MNPFGKLVEYWDLFSHGFEVSDGAGVVETTPLVVLAGRRLRYCGLAQVK